MSGLLFGIFEALRTAFFMFWDVLWPLALGFLISAVVQALVPRQAVERVLGSDDLRGIKMLRAMDSAPSPGHEMVHDHHDHEHHH